MKAIPTDEKVFMVDKRTNTTYGGSAALQAMQEWYTMEDVAYNVRPYKVFTALLTQAGGTDYQTITSGTLNPGVTYRITDNGGSGWDFTNVGAPNNNIDTYFIATGQTPNSWGDGGMLAYDLGAPVATVLENTMGNIFMTHSGNTGEYGIGWNLAFKQERTWCVTTPLDIEDPGLISITRKTDELIVVKTNSGGSPADDLLEHTPIEIRYYESYE